MSSFENANKLGPLKLAVEELLSKKEHRPQILRLIGEISGSIEADSKAHLETDQEDPDWFLSKSNCQIPRATVADASKESVHFIPLTSTDKIEQYTSPIPSGGFISWSLRTLELHLKILLNKSHFIF